MAFPTQFQKHATVLWRSKHLFAAFLVAVSLAALWSRPELLKLALAADQPVTTQAIKEKDTQIVPVICLQPGEKKACVLSTECTVGVTRGGGLSVREMGAPPHAADKKLKSWTKAGTTVTAPDFGEAAKTASSPQFAALKLRGYDAFVVTAEATNDAAEGMYEIHLADDTCSGHCKTTLRIVVHRPE